MSTNTQAAKRFQPTPEQLALSEERKAKKAKIAISNREPASEDTTETGRIIERSWIPTDSTHSHQGQRVKVFTWNLLAQCLVRRNLFPTSDCLKSSQREPMIFRELLATQADILCLQEVDRLDKLLPVLEQAGYAYHYASGPEKQHGCLIAFKAKLYNLLSTRKVQYDDEEIRPDGSDKARRDFNFAPDDPGYSLLVGDPLLAEQEQRLLPSYVVHMSVDPTVPRVSKDEAEEGKRDPDKVITSARLAIPTDGLLSPDELAAFFAEIPRLRSVYDVGLGNAKEQGIPTYGGRVTLGPSRRGYHEPEYTSYTHYWKTVLDPVGRTSCVVSVLSPHKKADIELGLPQKDVSGSDHVSLAAELCWHDVDADYPKILISE
ncbi:hypothetical protein H0H81_007517 [Sphagnurus paluster]|uniref:Endonuclease/exonuclease/phosphatase domain-containing protein n=1 Tax=Sphagnurus paluster TaxID=117069 RepID=A0A9P7KKX7_9AGAR|nr:hypothetical protein H0H81_007517 [Sphagnurus paluster]